MLLTGAGTSGVGSAFNPASVANLTLWLKADAGTSTTTDGVGISQWSDQSGGANHATQATGSQQPLYKAAIQNGLPVVRFDGTDDLMTIANLSNNQAARSIFVVTAQAVATDAKAVLSANAGTAAFLTSGGVWCWYQNQAGSAQSLGVGAAAWHVLTIVFTNTTTANAWVDSTTTSFDPSDNYQAGGLSWILGSYNSGALDAWNGDVGEVLIYDAALNATDRANVQTYLKNKWGTP